MIKPVTTRRARGAFMLAAATCASLAELAPMLSALRGGQSLLVVLLLGLAYQIGNGLARNVGSSPKVIASLAGLGLAVWLLAGQTVWVQMVAVATASAALQAVRRALADDTQAPKISPAMKRSFRVAGFVLAAAMPAALAMGLTALTTAVGAALLAFAALQRKREVAAPLGEAPMNQVQSRLFSLMVIHQTHYFVYAYAVIYLAFQLASENVLVAAGAFALGWITYLSAQTLWRRLPDEGVFIFGHTFLAACLLALAMAGTSWAAVVLWVLTGFGGGSVYCLTAISEKAGLSKDRVERAEDIGHVSGLVLAIALVAGVGIGANGLAFVGACLAAAAATVLLQMRGRLRTSTPT